MARKPDAPPRSGKPPYHKEINEKSFKAMCKQQCTKGEIAAFLDMDENTVSAWCMRTYNEQFSVVYKRFSEGGKRSLRRAMWKKAVADGNTVMMIWLSKNYLGMTDKIESVDDDIEPFIIETSKGEYKLGISKKRIIKEDDSK